MTCCTGHCAAAGFFNTRLAERDLRRYRRRGPDASTRTLLAACPIQFVVGDFALIGATLPEADVVTLDRVVCCYPDAESLLRAAAARSRRLLAFTHPRDRWFMRAGFALMNFFFWLARNSFRIFVHSPQRMASVLEGSGFVSDCSAGIVPLVFPSLRPCLHLKNCLSLTSKTFFSRSHAFKRRDDLAEQLHCEPVVPVLHQELPQRP